MKKIFLLFALIAFPIAGGNLNAQTDTTRPATVFVDLDNSTTFNSKTFFNVFIEFLRDYVNGPAGMWAQEIMDRGFDVGYIDCNVGAVWNRTYYPEGNNQPWYTGGGYNPNGEYYLVNMSYMQGGRSETSQTFFYSDTVSYTGYSYVKTNMITGHGNILVTDKDGKDTIVNVPVPDKLQEWTKYDFTIPKGLPYKQLKLIYTVSDTGELDVDEASVMPDNNVMGVRSEWHKLLKEMNTGIIRYPGGCFSDLSIAQFPNAIGNIDFRKSPLLESNYYFLRMDFGIDEFMQYCEVLGAEPMITLNFAHGTPESAMQWIRYMTADTTDYWGHRRFENGRLKPYKLHYIEVGNEQDNNGGRYAAKTRAYYDSIKAYNPDYVVVLNGCVCDGDVAFLDSLYRGCDGKMDLHSYHPALAVNSERVSPDDENIAIQFFLGASDFTSVLAHSESLLDSLKLYPKVKNCITEWWTHWASWNNWLEDTTWQNETLVMGVANAGILISMLNFADRLEFVSRTLGVNFVRKYLNKQTGDRAIYGVPAYDASYMINTHLGNTLHDVITDSQVGGYYHPENHAWYNETPYIQAAATSNKDSVYVAIINRDPYNDRTVNLNLLKKFNIGRRYELYTDDVMERKSWDHQDAVCPKEVATEAKDGAIILPKHSFTILAFAFKDSIEVKEDTLGVTDLSSGIILYPNPARENENVILLVPEITNPDLYLFDYNGKEVKVGYSLDDVGLVIKSSELPVGNYYGQLKYVGEAGDARSLCFKFVKI